MRLRPQTCPQVVRGTHPMHRDIHTQEVGAWLQRRGRKAGKAYLRSDFVANARAAARGHCLPPVPVFPLPGIYTHTHTHTHCTHTCMHSPHIHMCTARAHVHTCMHTQARVHTHACAHICVCTHTHMCFRKQASDRQSPARGSKMKSLAKVKFNLSPRRPGAPLPRLTNKRASAL